MSEEASEGKFQKRKKKVVMMNVPEGMTPPKIFTLKELLEVFHNFGTQRVKFWKLIQT